MAAIRPAFIVAFVTLQVVLAGDRAQTQLERSIDGKKSYQIQVPGKDPITIIETDPKEPLADKWIDVTLDPASKNALQSDEDAQNRYADVTVDHFRCLGPSCREENSNASPPDHLEEFLMEYADKIHGMGGDAKERLQAISALASKLKQDKSKADRYDGEQEDNEDKSYPSSWNRLKVKQHKHPYDDRDGWVTMEAVPWSSSKISKWKPNSNKHRPNHWDDDTYSYDDRPAPEETKRPNIKRPTYINNQPHYNNDYNEAPSKPSWTQQSISASYPSTWSPDEGRRPHKPNCDSDSHRHPLSDPSVYYGMSDSVVTDTRPSNFPYEYQALKRPMRRPTQVVYAGFPDDEARPSHPSSGDGQWVLLSTTKGYHHSKKRPRSMTTKESEDPLTLTSHRTVSLTVLPLEDGKENMTTSHGGMLEVERSFKTVEESKQDLDNQMVGESGTAAPLRKKVVRRRLVGAGTPGADSSAVLAAVGAGMLPATMAMVVPMMLGRRRRRDLRSEPFPQPLYRFE